MRFALLGPLEVHDENDVPLSVPGERPRVLLAALLLHANTTVSGDALAEAVWGSQDVADTAGALRSVVRRLRQALGSGPGSRITTRSPGYVISLQMTELDVPQFEEWCRRSAAAVHGQQWQDATDCAEQALRLWRGTPLMDVPSPVLYDRFGVRLEQLRLQVLEHRHEAELRLGRHEPLVPALQDAISQYPLHERFRAQLLVALARGGRQAEALTAYQDVRRLLIEELAIEPGAELRDLHERILVGAPVALSGHGGEQADEPQSGTSGTPAPADGAIPRPVPRTLPAPPRLFVGRRAESDELAALVRHTREDAAGTVVISAVDGMAGVGKTALAVHVAHRVAERFPDGQLFVDLHGYTRGEAQRTSGDVLAELLQLFGFPAGQIPSDTTARAAVYRDRLAGTRTLIVLDNAADEAQVEPLLPGLGGCLVLITSRRRLKALDDAHTVSLDVLPLAQAAELFRRAVGIERVPDLRVAEEIAELCGCLPLALRIAAALLRHRSSWSADHLAQQLRAVAPGTARFVDGQRDLAAMLDLSLNALSQDAVTLFRRLGAAPGPTVDAYAAATLLENDPAGAERLLQDLVDHSLLTEPTPGRYRLHDLIRAHAYHKAAEDESEREQARTRLIRYYERTAGTASGRVARLRAERPDEPASEHMPPLPDEPSAWAWLRSERANLEAAFDDTVARGEDEHTVALCAGLTELLRSDGPWARALSMHDAAAQAAQRSGDQAGYANGSTELGIVRYLTGDYPGATEILPEALRLHRALGNRLGQATALLYLGTIRYMTGDCPGAADCLEQSLENYLDSGNRQGQSDALIGLGNVRQLTGDLPGATEAFDRALETALDLGNRHVQANAFGGLGTVRQLTGDLPGATEAFTRVLEIAGSLGNRQGQAHALAFLGRVQDASGDPQGAAESFTQALEIYRELDYRQGQVLALVQLGAAQLKAGALEPAAESLTSALALCRETGDASNEAWALNHYAALTAAQGDPATALALYRDVLAKNRQLQKPDEEAISLEGIGDCLLVTGDTPGGEEHLRQALEIFQRLGMRPDAERVQSRLAGLTG